MTIQTSTVPQFQDALKAQLEARPNLSDVSVCIGPPSPGIAQVFKWIAFLGESGTEKWTAMGRMSREENYTQNIYISVLTRDGEADSTVGRDIAYFIRSELATQLVEDPAVNDTVWQAQLGKEQKLELRLGVNAPGPNGEATTDLSFREAALYCTVVVKNRMFGTR